jgi:hypothetical protein
MLEKHGTHRIPRKNALSNFYKNVEEKPLKYSVPQDLQPDPLPSRIKSGCGGWGFSRVNPSKEKRHD